jgi:hypothetical protein
MNCNFGSLFKSLSVVHEFILEVTTVFKPDKVIGERRKLHSEELNDMFCSPIIVGVIKSRRMRWAGYVARMGKGRGVYRVLVGEP